MSDAFKALADPTRREILQLLKDKDLTAGEISSKFTISKPAISKHLDVLKNSELVFCRKEGQYIFYSINTTALQNILGGFLELFENTKAMSEYEKQK